MRWIGAEDSDNPAPTVTVTAAAHDAAHGSDHGDEAAATPTPAERTAAATTEDGGDGLAIVALIVGALGLLAGVAALVAARRARA